MQALERASNIAVLIVAAIAVVSFVKVSFWQTPPRPKGDSRAEMARTISELTGKRIDLPGADLAENGIKKVVLSLSVSCHSCEQSAPFYRKLGNLRSNGTAFRLIAALPQARAKQRRTSWGKV